MEGQKAELPAKLSKSCIPCRDRKTRCDAPIRGRPCSNCARKSWHDRCILPTRKRREVNPGQKARTRARPSPPRILPAQLENDQDPASRNAIPSGSSPESTIVAKTNALADRSDKCRDPTKYQISLNYLNILEQVEDHGPHGRDQSNNLAEGLVEESPNSTSGSSNSEAILRAYFDFVDPFAPIMDRTGFIRSYKSGCYSLFLMHATLASGALHVSPDIISECGFGSRLEAQASFSSRATLLYDFGCEVNSLHLLQGSLLLGAVVITFAVDKDCHYWLYNSVRLITRTDMHRNVTCEGKDASVSKLYRRMWWTLYCRDVHFTYIGAQRTGLVSQLKCNLTPLTPQDWEPETIPDGCDSLLKPLKSQQISAFISYCQLAVTGACLCHWTLATVNSSVNQCLADSNDRDPESVVQPLEAWRDSLRAALQMNSQSQLDMTSSFLLASSYRFECILLRLLRPKWQSLDPTRSEWARRQLRYATFELDTITGRMLACNTLLEAPLHLHTYSARPPCRDCARHYRIRGQPVHVSDIH
ncbi:hypothetical protein ACJZ2D_014071 [Fusarium nematophilum]